MRHPSTVRIGILLRFFLAAAVSVSSALGFQTETDARIQAAVQNLKSADESIRAEACNFLAETGKAAVPVLKEALKDREIRGIVIFLLGRIGADAKDALPPLTEFLKDEDKNIRAKTAEALGKIGPETIPALLKALKDKEAVVRLRAVQALGRLGSAAKDVSSSVVDMLQDPDENVRAEAEKAVEKISQ